MMVEFRYKNCKICRLKCVERDEPNEEGLKLSFDSIKYRGQCKPKEEPKND